MYSQIHIPFEFWIPCPLMSSRQNPALKIPSFPISNRSKHQPFSSAPAMSVATAASSSPSSLCNQIPRGFLPPPTRKTCLLNHLSPDFPAFPSLVLPSRRFFFYHSNPVFYRNSTGRRIGVLLSGESVGGVELREVSGELSWDAFLSAAEILCILPPSLFSICCVVGLVIPGGSKLFQLPALANKVFMWQFLLLVSAVAIGGLIRRRQWRRICGKNKRAADIDLIARIEKVEEDMRSSVMIVQALSRQLEKLGIKFRVTRKALKEPIAQTAALAKKNSEVTRALAMQEDILEKELVEIQKVLLAMQEQQQKQLELILAVVKAGRLLESNQGTSIERGTTAAVVSVPGKKEGQKLETQGADIYSK